MNITLDPVHRALRAGTVVAAVLVPLYFLVGSLGLASELPMQYSFDGEVSRTGSVTEARVTVAVPGVVAIGLIVLARFPHTFNYLVAITEDNKLRQYRNAVQMMLWLAATFVGVQIIMVGQWLHGWPIILVFVPLAAIGAAAVYFLSRMFRLK